MASRKEVFFNGGVFHIFNKTIDNRQVFTNSKVNGYFLKLLRYYRSSKADIRYSYFRKMLPQLRKLKEIELANNHYFKVNILAFCLMPNHFHLLLKQKEAEGIVRFLSDISNALTRYHNELNRRKGPIFLPQFKSKKIENRSQLIHVSRYIHLNPYSSGLINSMKNLDDYELCSFREYQENYPELICNTSILLDEFNGKKKNYRTFVYNNAEYQRTLEQIKHVNQWL